MDVVENRRSSRCFSLHPLLSGMMIASDVLAMVSHFWGVQDRSSRQSNRRSCATYSKLKTVFLGPAILGRTRSERALKSTNRDRTSRRFHLTEYLMPKARWLRIPCNTPMSVYNQGKSARWPASDAWAAATRKLSHSHPRLDHPWCMAARHPNTTVVP